MKHSSSKRNAASQGGEVVVSSRRLKVMVLMCGAVLMSLEMVGSRMISPYFGNSVYVWGSLISIFLGALSLGYYIGGRLVDKNPSMRLLSSIIATAGILLLLLRYVSPHVCRAVYDSGMGVRMGTLVSSVILFFIPSVFLGIVSPFAVRLAARSVSTLGETAGMLYALSTLGSIIGTLLTSFVLIDYLGTNAILLLLGATLLGTSLLGLMAAQAPAEAQRKLEAEAV